MKKFNFSIFSFIKYLIFFILAILSIYLMLITKGLIEKPYPPKNSIEVSPLSGKSITTATHMDIIYNVKYNDSNIFELYRIYDNEIVFEIYDKKTDLLKYTASSIQDIGSHPTINYLGSDDIVDFPNLSFINYSSDNHYNFESSTSDVFLEYSEETATSFIYTAGQYKYINSISQQAEHVDTGHGLTFSNILIQFIDEKDKTFGEGILFTNGSSKEVVWKNSLYMCKDTHGPLTLNKGNTIWIPLKLSDKDKLIYN